MMSEYQYSRPSVHCWKHQETYGLIISSEACLSLFHADVNFFVSDNIYIFYLLPYFIKKKERNGWSPFGWFYTHLSDVYNWRHSGILAVHVQNLHHVQPDVDEERIGRLVVGPEVHVVLQKGRSEHIGGFSDVAFLLSCRARESVVKNILNFYWLVWIFKTRSCKLHAINRKTRSLLKKKKPFSYVVVTLAVYDADK